MLWPPPGTVWSETETVPRYRPVPFFQFYHSDDSLSNQFGFPEAFRPYSPNDDPRANELIAADRDFNSEQDALAWLGGVIDYDTFCQAVN